MDCRFIFLVCIQKKNIWFNKFIFKNDEEKPIKKKTERNIDHNRVQGLGQTSTDSLAVESQLASIYTNLPKMVLI